MWAGWKVGGRVAWLAVGGGVVWVGEGERVSGGGEGGIAVEGV